MMNSVSGKKHLVDWTGQQRMAKLDHAGDNSNSDNHFVQSWLAKGFRMHNMSNFETNTGSPKLDSSRLEKT